MIPILNFLRFIFDKITLKRMLFLFFLFVFSIAIGWYVGHLLYSPPKISVQNKLVHLPSFRKFFFANYLIAIVLVFGGYLSGGIITVFIIILNGFTTGYGINYTDSSKNGGFMGIIYKYIFHAPLELFALFLMGSIGLRGFDIIKGIIKTNSFNNSKIVISEHMGYQYFVGSFLLLLAAFIEHIVIIFST